MTLDEFINKWSGVYADFDGYYGAQCSDLAQFYNRDVVGGPFLTGEAAADLWETYPVQLYERILNTIDAVPQKGDLMIWKKTSSLPWGHVAICVSGDQNSFKSFDQNWPTGSPAHIVDHNYNGVLGWLRPIKTTPAPVVTDEYKKTMMAYNAFYELPERVISDLDGYKKTIDNLNAAISQKDSQIATLQATVSNQESTLLSDKATIDSLTIKANRVDELTSAVHDLTDSRDGYMKELSACKGALQSDHNATIPTGKLSRKLYLLAMKLFVEVGL